MNKTPRRQVRVLPPLRGRLAAVVSPKHKRRYSEPVIHKSPLVAKSYPKVSFPKATCPIEKNSDENQVGQNNCSPASFNQYLIGWILMFVIFFAIANFLKFIGL